MDAPEENHSECSHSRAVGKVRLILAAWRKYKRRCRKKKYVGNSQRALEHFYSDVQENVFHSSCNFGEGEKSFSDLGESAHLEAEESGTGRNSNLYIDLETESSLTDSHERDCNPISANEGLLTDSTEPKKSLKINERTCSNFSIPTNENLVTKRKKPRNPVEYDETSCNDPTVTIQEETSLANKEDALVTSSSKHNMAMKRKKTSNSLPISDVTNLADYNGITTFPSDESSFQVQLMTHEPKFKPSTSGSVCTLPKNIYFKSKRAKRNVTVRKTVMRNLAKGKGPQDKTEKIPIKMGKIYVKKGLVEADTFRANKKKQRRKSANDVELAEVNDMQCMSSNKILKLKELPDSEISCLNLLSNHSSNTKGILQDEFFIPEENLKQKNEPGSKVVEVRTMEIPVKMRRYSEEDLMDVDTFSARKMKERCKGIIGRLNNIEVPEMNHMQSLPNKKISRLKEPLNYEESCSNLLPNQEKCLIQEINMTEKNEPHSNDVEIQTMEMRRYDKKNVMKGDTFRANKVKRKCDIMNGEENDTQSSMSNENTIQRSNLLKELKEHHSYKLLEGTSITENLKTSWISITKSFYYAPFITHAPHYIERGTMLTDLENNTILGEKPKISEVEECVAIEEVSSSSNTAKKINSNDHTKENRLILDNTEDGVLEKFGTLPFSNNFYVSCGKKNKADTSQISESVAEITEKIVPQLDVRKATQSSKKLSLQNQHFGKIKNYETLSQSQPIHNSCFYSDERTKPGTSKALETASEIMNENVTQLNLGIATQSSKKLASPISQKSDKIEKPKTSEVSIANVKSPKKIGRVIEHKMKKIRKKQVRRNIILPSKDSDSRSIKPKIRVGDKYSSRNRDKTKIKKKTEVKKNKKPKEDKISCSEKKIADKRPKLKTSKIGLSKLRISRKNLTAKKSSASKLIKTTNYSIPQSIEILNSSKSDIYGGYRTLEVSTEDRRKESSPEIEILAEKITNNFYPNKLEHFRTIKTRVDPNDKLHFGVNSDHPSNTIKKNSAQIEMIQTRTSNDTQYLPMVSSTVKSPECSSIMQPLNLEAKKNQKLNTGKSSKIIKAAKYSIPVHVEIISSTSNLAKGKLVQTVIPRYYKVLRKGDKATRAPEIEPIAIPLELPTKAHPKHKALGRFQELEISIKKCPRAESQPKNNSSHVNILYNQRGINLKQSRKSYSIPNHSDRANSSSTGDSYTNENSSFCEVPKNSRQPKKGSSYPDKCDENVDCAGSKIQSLEPDKFNGEFKIAINNSGFGEKTEDSCKTLLANMEANTERIRDVSDIIRKIGHTEVNAMCANTLGTMANAAKLTENSCHNIQREITTDENRYEGYDFKKVVIPPSPSIFSDTDSRESFLAITLDDNDQSIEQTTVDNVMGNIDSWSDDSFGI